MASNEINTFLWKGSTWPVGAGTGPGFTGGYWNYAPNWYEKVGGISSGYTGAAEPGSYWYKVADRFPRGNDVVLLDSYTTADVGIQKNGPDVTLSWGGYTNGHWFGATGESGSGASGNSCVISIKSDYPTTWYIGVGGPTGGGGSFGVPDVGGRQVLMVNSLEFTTFWRRANTPPRGGVHLYNSQFDNFKHKGTAQVRLWNSIINSNYDCEIDSDCLAGQGWAILRGCTFGFRFDVSGDVAPYVYLGNCTGTTGGNLNQIRRVNITAGDFINDKITIAANIERLNYYPVTSEGSSAANTLILDAPSGNTSCGENRIHIGEINQGWDPDIPWVSGSTLSAILELRCGATIDNHNFQSGTLTVSEDVGPTEKICVVDGMINANALVKSYHPTNESYQGFRIGADRGNTQEGYLILNKGAQFDFNPGMFVLADYALGTTGAELAFESGGGK